MLWHTGNKSTFGEIKDHPSQKTLFHVCTARPGGLLRASEHAVCWSEGNKNENWDQPPPVFEPRHAPRRQSEARRWVVPAGTVRKPLISIWWVPRGPADGAGRSTRGAPTRRRKGERKRKPERRAGHLHTGAVWNDFIGANARPLYRTGTGKISVRWEKY